MTELLPEWAAWQRAAGLSERTIRERCSAVQTMADMAVNHLDKVNTRDVITYLGRRGIAQASKATYQGHLRAFFKWCIDAGIREDNPIERVPKVRRPKSAPRPTTGGQLSALLAVCNRKRTKAMVLLAALAGLRVHEVAKIRGDDLDLDALTLTVLGKGGKQAVIPLHDDLVTLAAHFPRHGYWFPNHAGTGPVNAKAVGVSIARAMGRAGFDGTAHQLRHWYGTTLVHAGVDLRTVQELMRHENIQTTQIYTLVSSAQRTAAIGLLHLPAAA